MDALGNYIECQKCKNTYNENVLDYNPEKESEKFQAEYDDAIKKIMILMSLVDGKIEESEIDSILAIYEKITSAKMERDKLVNEIEEVKQSNKEIIDYTSSLRGQLNDQGKEMIIKAAFLIATSDGEFHETEQDLLTQISSSLDLSSAHLRAILDEMNQE